MLARPLASETVMARAVWRLKCSVVANVTAGARRSPNARAAAASLADTSGRWSDERGAGKSELRQRADSEHGAGRAHGERTWRSGDRQLRPPHGRAGTPDLRGGLAVRQRPARPREVAVVALRVALEVVLVLALGLPERDGLADLGHHRAGPQA